ncbi:MAG: glycosyltransferase [Deltaproteobacteria bacterium]|nr:glycosyltransferase [Deltaproteobacteria bacterium]
MLSVGVLVDLKWGPEAGGQVKCWERFAEAAEAFRNEIDLTVHFQGDGPKAYMLSENVRFVVLPPALSTSRFRSMDGVADHTDLAPFHPRLLPYLKQYDVIHTTDAFFAMAKTALIARRLHGIPLVTSIHTDTPKYTKIYSAHIIRNITQNGALGRLLLDRFHLDDVFSSFMSRKLERFAKRCRWIFVSKDEDLRHMARLFPGKGVSFLRRGIDTKRFHPRLRDRHRLQEAFGIAEDRFVVIFAGRVDQGKNVMTLARAARLLLDQDEHIHVLFVGEGAQKSAIGRLLGDSVTLPGVVHHSTLGWLYASSDALAFPSRIEVCPNVVLEARASGLPVLVPAEGGAAQLVKNNGQDGVLVPLDLPQTWAAEIRNLIHDRDRSKRMGEAARKIMKSQWPTWKEVFEKDLAPVWRRVASFFGKPPRGYGRRP